MHSYDPNNRSVEQSTGVELLEQLKAAMYEKSRSEGRLVKLGPLKNEQNAPLWNSDGISLQRRVDAGEITADELATADAAIEESFVPTTPGARKRCIDGSTGAGYDDTDPRDYGRPLGPQIQGGTVGEAVALRMAHGISEDEQDVTIIDDIATVARERKSKFAEGAHDDDKSRDHTVKTGCGQVDGGPRKQPRYNQALYSEVYLPTADAVLSLAGLQAPEGGYERIEQTAAVLAGRPEYFSSPAKIVAAVRQENADGIETVIRPHNETWLIINLVPNTTFHRDNFNARTDSKIQCFGLDAWNIVEEHDPMTAYALVVDAAATFMDLTDGSIEVQVRLPRVDTSADIHSS
ncbi:MAG TPA: hypothetical protein VK983_01770 [Candidatus Limnocylindrales bacterium]|nr:hypothetical protein [Candidatus Limnocylindrales bacterium]